jgi:hypothetical protein
MIEVEPKLQLFRDDEMPKMHGIKRPAENSKAFRPCQLHTSLVLRTHSSHNTIRGRATNRNIRRDSARFMDG